VHTVYAARAWARLSCCVQAASAQQILNRDFVDWSEVADVFDRIAALQPVYQKWYMDDGGIVGSPELLLKVWEILKKGGVPLGLELNSKKCEMVLAES